LRIFHATILSLVDECRWITFNLPPKPQAQTQKVKDLDEGKLWEGILDKCKGYDEQLKLEEAGKSGFLLLKRHKAGHCNVCNRVHNNSDSFIFFKGKEESVLLGCYCSQGKYIYIPCLKPELREAHDYEEERDTEPKDGQVIKDKEWDFFNFFYPW